MGRGQKIGIFFSRGILPAVLFWLEISTKITDTLGATCELCELGGSLMFKCFEQGVAS